MIDTELRWSVLPLVLRKSTDRAASPLLDHHALVVFQGDPVPLPHPRILITALELRGVVLPPRLHVVKGVFVVLQVVALVRTVHADLAAPALSGLPGAVVVEQLQGLFFLTGRTPLDSVRCLRYSQGRSPPHERIGLAQVERIAVWMNGNDSTLVLNDDGRLLEKAHRGARFLLVHNNCSGTQACLYALSKNYELVGTISPQDFIPPELPERNKMAVSEKRESKQDQYFNFVRDLINEEQISAKAAFERAAEHFKTTAGNVSTAYYRMKREHEGGITPADTSRRAYAVNRLAVPEELRDILPIARAGLDAHERIIAWAEAKKQELDEREASIAAREQEAKERIQKELTKIFA